MMKSDPEKNKPCPEQKTFRTFGCSGQKISEQVSHLHRSHRRIDQTCQKY